LGPMMAWTSPAFTWRSMPRRISLSSTLACRFLISRIIPSRQLSADDPLQAHAQQLLRLDGELHRQVQEHLLAEAVDDHVYRGLRGQAALLAVKNLVLADLRGGRLVLPLRAGVLHLDVREGVRPAAVAQKQRVAL